MPARWLTPGEAKRAAARSGACGPALVRPLQPGLSPPVCLPASHAVFSPARPQPPSSGEGRRAARPIFASLPVFAIPGHPRLTVSSAAPCRARSAAEPPAGGGPGGGGASRRLREGGRAGAGPSARLPLPAGPCAGLPRARARTHHWLALREGRLHTTNTAEYHTRTLYGLPRVCTQRPAERRGVRWREPGSVCACVCARVPV